MRGSTWVHAKYFVLTHRLLCTMQASQRYCQASTQQRQRKLQRKGQAEEHSHVNVLVTRVPTPAPHC